jgi:hypothetical protein
MTERPANAESFSYRYLRLYGQNLNDDYIYAEKDGKYTLLLDVPCVSYAVGDGYIYAQTREGTIIQLSMDGQFRNTIYHSDNTISQLMYHEDSIYFVDGDQVIRINTDQGTMSPILRCAGQIGMDNYGPTDACFFILIRQGLYIEHYFFYPDTLEVEITWEL